MKTQKYFRVGLLSLLVVIAIITAMILGLSIDNFPIVNAESNKTQSLYEDKIYSENTIEDNFDGDSLLVVMDKYNSGINKKHENKFLTKSLIKSIKDLTSITGDIGNKKYLNRENFRQILKVELKQNSKQHILDTIREIEKIDGVLWVGPNEYDSLMLKPSVSTGTRYSSLWGLHGEYGIQAEEAWDSTTGNTGVRVGVIDTGIADHPDLPNVTTGWDFVNDNEVTNDDQFGHGTHVAGTIGASGKDPNGVVGVNWNVQLVPLQVANSRGSLPLDAVTEAITWAINNNVDILNYSAGGLVDNVARRTAISNYQGLFVCAAGNDGRDTDTTEHYPSDYSQGQEFSNRVISVGSINSTGDISYFSNFGATTVSLFAPGGSILSTYPTSLEPSGYKVLSGTSMATPHVTGAAALLYTRYLRNSHSFSDADIASQVKAALLKNATYDARYSGKCVSSGRLNVNKAFEFLPYIKVMGSFGYTTKWYNWNGKVDMAISNPNSFALNSENQIVFNQATTLDFSVGTQTVYNAWNEILSTVTFELKNSAGEFVPIGDSVTHSTDVRVGLISNVSYTNRSFTINTASLPKDTYTLNLKSISIRNGASYTHTRSFTFIVNTTPACVAEGSLITLADGRQIAVEDLTGEERLLVWNMMTGQFDSAPILFIDSDPYKEYEIINLRFSDGTVVEVIDEHAFWDIDLNKYVFLRKDAAKYIGHSFMKQQNSVGGELNRSIVKLIGVDITKKQTTAWSPVTYGHLCYFVNGLLSMPGATEGLINIFEVDSETMQYDAEKFASDIEKYGLFTYEEFAELVPISKDVFDAFNGQYLKVSIGKGLIDMDGIIELVERYADFLMV